ncbi:DNA-binding response regulator [Leptolinea sp. HRD-7]|nr:DNA-binding response regulator [Leptolinea sp. HRD-7]
MTKKKNLLVVDQDPKHITLMRQILSGTGFRVIAARTGEAAVDLAASEQPELIFMEINLEGEIDGCVAVRRIRDFSDVPVIFVCASDKPEDILQAFESGADDYISKPVHSQILLARMRAVIKRASREGMVQHYTEITCGSLKINIPGRQVTIDDREVYLSETEFNLILELAKNQGRVLMHEQLLSSVWGQKYSNEIDYLRSYIHILRRKLETDPQHPRLILSKPGVGYMLASEPAAWPGARE